MNAQLRPALPMTVPRQWPLPQFGAVAPQPNGLPVYDPPVPYHLTQLFQKVPKTENHLHLSGSVPEDTIEKFMVQNGLQPEEIRDQLAMLKSEYDDLDDFLATYYVVPAHVKTPAQFREAAASIVKKAAEENVRVMEIRSSVIKGDMNPEDIVIAIEEGMRDGMRWVREHKGYDMKSSLIILAQRFKSPEEALEHAKIAVKMGDRSKRPHSLVRGFDLAGSEAKHSLEKFKDAFDYINTYGKPIGVNLTIHAGETPNSEHLSGVEAIYKALEMGADRLGHAIEADNSTELKKLLKEKQIPMELCPWSNVQVGYVDPYTDHALKNFLEEGLNVSLSSDNRMMHKIDLSQQLGQLWAHHVIEYWDDVVRLTLNGVNMAFLSETDKSEARQDVIAEFKDLEKRYAKTIEQYLPRAPQSSSRRVNYFA